MESKLPTKKYQILRDFIPIDKFGSTFRLKFDADLTGLGFGKIKIISPVPVVNSKKRRKWLCLCEQCNETSIYSLSVLCKKYEKQKDKAICTKCYFKTTPKYNFVDLSGQQFNDLYVIKRLDEYTKTRGVIWLCKCSCGSEVKMSSNRLTSGNNKTCGNKVKHPQANKSTVGEITINYYNHIKQNAIKRNLLFDLNIDFLWNLFLKQNRKCALTSMKLFFGLPNDKVNDFFAKTTASLDRIDSHQGYIEANVQWVHKNVNIFKNSLNQDALLDMCYRIISTHKSNIGRPTWDEYFLNLAFNIANRSEDLHIQHGAIIVNNKTHHIIGTGYNATIKKSDKTLIDLTNRDYRRQFMIHAEENAILNSLQNPNNLPDGATMYITGRPCINCLQRIINFGISEICYCDRAGSITENTEYLDNFEKLVKMSKIKIKKVLLDNPWIKMSYYDLNNNHNYNNFKILKN